MAVEIKRSAEFHWPSRVRLPVVLTFEHQSGEGAQPIFGDRPNYMISDAIQYGARRGLWNILEELDKHSVKATFFVSGSTAERYTPGVRAVQKAGHELAGMSYSFDRVRTASPEKERDIIRRSMKALQDSAGTMIKGWRCPDYRISPQTLDLLAEADFEWDSSLLNDDLPYLFDCRGRFLAEIPFTTSTADKTFASYPHPQRGGPDGLLNVWNSEFDMLYEESQRDARYLILSMQTWVVGRPAVLRVLDQLLSRLASFDGLWYARCGEISQTLRPQGA
jgi:peptidoglycan/xylan/chitin deacetylase (PgdA/CDA1 family)